MPSYPVHAVTLACHPETPASAVRGVSARVGRNAGGMLAVTYVLEGDLDRLRVPAPRTVRASLARGSGSTPAARSSSRARACPRTTNSISRRPASGRRTRSSAIATARRSPASRTRRRSIRRSPCAAPRRRLELDAVIRLDRLSPAHPGARLSLALSAVVEEQRRRALVLGAQASARQAGFPSCRCVRPGAGRDGSVVARRHPHEVRDRPPAGGSGAAQAAGGPARRRCSRTRRR